MLNESFNIKNATLTAKDGHKYNIAYIDPATSENTYNLRDEIKKYGAKFFSDLKAWGWHLGQNPQAVYDKCIKPCLEYLVTVEDNGGGTRQNEVTSIIDSLIAELSSGGVSELHAPNTKNVREELQQFKADLLNCVSAEEFKKKIEPIIKFQQAQGHRFSFKNALLILCQDPEATLVKSKTGWFAMNREVVDRSHPILLFRPEGNNKSTDAEKRMITMDFLAEVGVNSVKELNPGQKEELRIRLRGNSNAQSFKTYFGFDIRFTKQIEGKEELVSGNSGEQLDWYNKSTDKNEYLSLLIDSATQMILDSGLKVKYVPSKELGGALGSASADGTIRLIENPEPVVNYANTIIHEFAHELLHLKYLKKTSEVNGNSEWAQFYVGTDKGRGFVEQQAELCAWMVLKHFNFDVTETSLVYTAGWGMTTPKAAATVFDTIADCASFIIRKIAAYMSKDAVSEDNSEEI